MKKIGLLLTCAAFAVPSPGSAQELPRTPEGRALWFNARGDALIRTRPAEAAQFYLRAWAEMRDCDLLYNAAMAFGRSSELGDLDRAVSNYRQYLQSEVAHCPSLAMHRGEVMATIDRLEAEVTERRQRLASVPTPPPAPTLTLVPAPPASLPVEVSPVVVTPHPVIEPPQYRTERSSANLSYTLWGVGALAVGFGVYSLITAGSESTLSSQQGVTDPDRHARAADSAALWGGLTTGLGVAAIGGGLAWYFLRPSRRVMVTPQVSLQTLGLSAQLRF